MKSLRFFYHVLVAIIIFLIGCSHKPEKVFDFDSTFEKVSTIDLKEVDELTPFFQFTEFGFFTWEPEFCKISKFHRENGFELSFGKKGSGPGEIGLGNLTYYSADEEKLGIFDFSTMSYLFFDSNGNYFKSNREEFDSYTANQYIKNGVTVKSFTKFPEDSMKKEYRAVISINDLQVLEKGIKADNNQYQVYLFSFFQEKIFILDRQGKEFDVFVSNLVTKELETLPIAKKHITSSDKNPIYSFIVFADFIIISHHRYQHYYNKFGDYLGAYDVEKEKGIDVWNLVVGAYDDYLYVHRIEKKKGEYEQFMDVYTVK